MKSTSNSEISSKINKSLYYLNCDIHKTHIHTPPWCKRLHHQWNFDLLRLHILLTCSIPFKPVHPQDEVKRNHLSYSQQGLGAGIPVPHNGL